MKFEWACCCFALREQNLIVLLKTSESYASSLYSAGSEGVLLSETTALRTLEPLQLITLVIASSRCNRIAILPFSSYANTCRQGPSEKCRQPFGTVQPAVAKDHCRKSSNGSRTFITCVPQGLVDGHYLLLTRPSASGNQLVLQ